MKRSGKIAIDPGGLSASSLLNIRYFKNYFLPTNLYIFLSFPYMDLNSQYQLECPAAEFSTWYCICHV